MLKRHISKGTMSKRHIVEASFIFITIFLYIFENPKRKNLLTLPVPSILKQLNEIKNNINFYFYASLWCLRKVLSRPQNLFEASKNCVDAKKYVVFPLICLCPYCRTPDQGHFRFFNSKNT